MFCDLVGSTPLSARLDPEDLRELITAFHSRVADAIGLFGGSIAQYLGDGVLSYFGWPSAREVDAERAVRAALAVVSAVCTTPIRGERLQVRVGIATGTVVVGRLTGSGEAGGQMAVGETPNRAARLQEASEPGGILIDQATRRQIGGLFDCRDVGEIALKGLRNSVRAWRVLQDHPIDNRFAAFQTGTMTPLVARDAELQLLLHRWQKAKSGAGQVVLLAGEPGIGKSRLIAELQARLSDEPHGTLQYFCAPYYKEIPLYPIIARVERDADFIRGDSAGEKALKLETMLLSAGASVEDISLMADLLAVPTSGRYPKLELSPQQRKQKTFATLIGLAVKLAREKPLLIVAEDAHWADPSSLEILGGLVGLLINLPILLVVSYRNEFIAPWAGNKNVTLVPLNPLSPHQSRELVEHVMTGHDVAPTLFDRIVTQTDGIPLFIEELTKAVLDATPEQSGVAPLLAVPKTLETLLMARLDRLPAAKRVAQIGAAIGRDFSHALLAAIAPIPDVQLTQGLDELTASGLALRSGEFPEYIFKFKHALVQDAAYESLLRSHRAEIHARIVTAAEGNPSLGLTEPGLLGHHCARAGVFAQAASYYRIAGGRSAERAAVAETTSYLERGLQFARGLSDGPDRYRLESELLLSLGRILMATKGPNSPDVRMVHEQAVTMCRQLGDPEMLARALYSLGIIFESQAELQAAQAIGEELLEIAASSGNMGIAIAARVRLGFPAYYQGKFIAARNNFTEALDLCAHGHEALHDMAITSSPDVAAAAYLGVTLAQLGYAEQAIAQGKLAVVYAKQVGSSSPAFATALSVWSRTLEVLRDDANCRDSAALLVSVAEAHGFPFLRALGRCQMGWIAVKEGEAGKGLAMLSEALDQLTSFGAKIHPLIAMYLMSDALAMSGHRHEAMAMINKVLAFSASTGASWLDAELHRRKAELFLLYSDWRAAETAFHLAIETARAQSAKLFELRSSVGLAKLLIRRDRPIEARQLLAPVYGWFTEGVSTPDLVEARTLLGTVAERP